MKIWFAGFIVAVNIGNAASTMKFRLAERLMPLSPVIDRIPVNGERPVESPLTGIIPIVAVSPGSMLVGSNLLTSKEVLFNSCVNPDILAVPVFSMVNSCSMPALEYPSRAAGNVWFVGVIVEEYVGIPTMTCILVALELLTDMEIPLGTICGRLFSWLVTLGVPA